jgi:hypothetical protein
LLFQPAPAVVWCTPILHCRTFFQGLCVRGCPSAMCQRSSFSRCAMSLCLNTLTCTQARTQHVSNTNMFSKVQAEKFSSYTFADAMQHACPPRIEASNC